MSRIKDLFSCTVLLAVIGVLWFSLHEVPEQAAYYPKALLMFTGGLVMLLFITSLLNKKRARATTSQEDKPLPPDGEASGDMTKIGLGTFLVLGLSLIYVVLMPYLGFIIASTLLLIAFMYCLGVRSLPVLFLVPLVEIGLLWFVFERLLAVLLPDAEWLRGLIGM
jgi:hypothetical protein